MGKTWFYRFAMDKNSMMLAPPPSQKRKIEIFGDSITCGYATRGYYRTRQGHSPFENGYLSYASITASHFDAELHSISRSGIGMLVSWFPMVMPDMYNRAGSQ